VAHGRTRPADDGVTVTAAREATVSLRWLLPFIRATGADPRDIHALASAGVSLRDFARADTWISHRLAIELLEDAVTRTQKPQLGLIAGEQLQPGDLDVLDYAARSCATLREAIRCLNSYIRIMHGALTAELLEHDGTAVWQLRSIDGVAQPPAAGDFVVSAAYAFVREYAESNGRRGILREVHLRHGPAPLAEYQRVFDGADVHFDMSRDALVFSSEGLDSPMTLAHAGLQSAFEMQARALLDQLKSEEGFVARVRQITAEQLRYGSVGMPYIARRLGMSAATLRRRLQEEGTSHSEILDEIRHELSAQYLSDTTLSIKEIAALLRFSQITSYYKAFRRWSNGMTPAGFRAELRARRAPRHLREIPVYSASA
jgi:AraC-like DNA-binding protein